MKSIEVQGIEELADAAKEFLQCYPQPGIFAFYGEMGAGKTTFIQAICNELGVVDNVTSPTFALVNEYSSPGNGTAYHFDFYRIENIKEVYDLGYEEYFYQGDWCFIEWPEMIDELLPTDSIKVSIEVTGDSSRKLSFTACE